MVADSSTKTPKQQVARIIFGVLAKNISVRNALLQFPTDKDKSIQCAWHALAHYDADEDIRRRDRGYADEQDDYLEMIGFMLEKDQPLPQNIIVSYEKYYEDAPLPVTQSFKEIFKSLFRFIT